MRTLTCILSVSALGLGAAFVLAGPARAAEPVQIAGKNACKTVEQHAVPVEGDPDHIVFAEKVTCNTSATGQSSMFNEGQLVATEAGDLVKGNGPVHGYILGKYKEGNALFTFEAQV